MADAADVMLQFDNLASNDATRSRSTISPMRDSIQRRAQGLRVDLDQKSSLRFGSIFLALNR